jgi:hypothetical protein
MKASSYFRSLQRHLESLGEVESVTFVRFPPTLLVSAVPVFLPGQAPSGPDEAVRVPQLLVTPGFFETLAIPIVRGRAFDDRDSQSGRQSVVVDQVLAARLWPDADPIGQTLFVQGNPHEVIGVAQYKGVRRGGLAPGACLFRADRAFAAGSGRMLVRVKGDSRTMHWDGLDNDISDHIERETQDNIEQGMAPDEARRQAPLKFGNVAMDSRRDATAAT